MLPILETVCATDKIVFPILNLFLFSKSKAGWEMYFSSSQEYCEEGTAVVILVSFPA